MHVLSCQWKHKKKPKLSALAQQVQLWSLRRFISFIRLFLKFTFMNPFNFPPVFPPHKSLFRLIQQRGRAGGGESHLIATKRYLKLLVMHGDAGAVHCARHRNRRREKPHQGNNKPLKGTQGGERGTEPQSTDKGKGEAVRQTAGRSQQNLAGHCCKTSRVLTTHVTHHLRFISVGAGELIKPESLPASGVCSVHTVWWHNPSLIEWLQCFKIPD